MGQLYQGNKIVFCDILRIEKRVNGLYKPQLIKLLILNDAESEFDEQLRKVFGAEDTFTKKIDEFTPEDE